MRMKGDATGGLALEAPRRVTPLQPNIVPRVSERAEEKSGGKPSLNIQTRMLEKDKEKARVKPSLNIKASEEPDKEDDELLKKISGLKIEEDKSFSPGWRSPRQDSTSDTASDDEVKAIESDSTFNEKGPTTPRDKLKKDLREQCQPYVSSKYLSPSLQCGGKVQHHPPKNDEEVSLQELNDFMKTLSPRTKQMIDEAVDVLINESRKEKIYENPVTPGDDSAYDTWGSPDSSISSPSPAQRYIARTLSESEGVPPPSPQIEEEPKLVAQQVFYVPPPLIRNQIARSQVQTICPKGVLVDETDMDKSGRERLRERLTGSQRLTIEWALICIEKDDVFYALQPDSSSSLMLALRKNKDSLGYLEQVFSRVERAVKFGRLDYLMCKDVRGESALYIAAIHRPSMPILTRFIADAIISLKEDPDQVYCCGGGGLLHAVVQKGDSHAAVLAELLNARGPSGHPVFKVNFTDSEARTPLHLAVTCWLPSITTAGLLVNHGASVKKKDGNGRTPLHLAVGGPRGCDPEMVKVLLQSLTCDRSTLNLTDNQRNTALHIAAANSFVSIARQKKVIRMLVTNGASHDLHNSCGKYALNLVDPSRKEEIADIIKRKK